MSHRHSDTDAELAVLRADAERLRGLIVNLKTYYALRREAVRQNSPRLWRDAARVGVHFDRCYARFFGEEKAGFNPDQPRDDHGQWTTAGGGQGGDGYRADISAARRRHLGVSEAECDSQYKRDIIICKLVKTPLCYARAMDRYVACMKGAPIPPLNF